MKKASQETNNLDTKETKGEEAITQEAKKAAKNTTMGVITGNMNEKKMKVHLVLLSIQFGFAGWHVLGKTALNAGVEPLVLAFYRGLGSAFLLMSTAWFSQAKGGGGSLYFQSKHVLLFILLGFLNYGNMVGSIVGLKYTSAVNYAILQPSIPVFAMAMSFLFGMEPVKQMKVIGVLVSVAGAIYVECQSQRSKASTSFNESYHPALGNTIIIGQCLSMASLTVAQKHVVKTYPPIVIVAWHSSIAACFTSATCLFCGMPSLWLDVQDGLAWVAVAYGVCVASYYCYFAYGWALRTASPTVVLAYSTFQPVGTMMLSYIFLGTYPTSENILGGGIVVLGLVLTMWNSQEGKDKGESESDDKEKQNQPYRLLPNTDNPGNK